MKIIDQRESSVFQRVEVYPFINPSEQTFLEPCIVVRRDRDLGTLDWGDVYIVSDMHISHETLDQYVAALNYAQQVSEVSYFDDPFLPLPEVKAVAYEQT